MASSVIFLAAALMTTGLVIGKQGDSLPPVKNECKFQSVSKTFSLQDPQNNTCTFKVPHWRCNGLCRTETLVSSKTKYNEVTKVYELKGMDIHCRCCQPDPSRVSRNVSVGEVQCKEGYKWSGEPVTIDLVWGCECLSCINNNPSLPQS